MPTITFDVPDGALSTVVADRAREGGAHRVGAYPMYLGYYCNTPQNNAQKAGSGQSGALVHISAAALFSILVMVPSSRREPPPLSFPSWTQNYHPSQPAAKRADLEQTAVQPLLTGRTRSI